MHPVFVAPPAVWRLVIRPFRCYIGGDFGRAENRFRSVQAGRGRKVRTPEGAMPRNPRSAAAGGYTRAKCFKAFRRKVPQKMRPPRSQERGKGEKVRQELTACRAIARARKTPSGARPNRKPRSGPLRVPPRRNRFRVSAAETNDSLPRFFRGRQNSAYSPSKIIFSQRRGEFRSVARSRSMLLMGGFIRS